MTETREPPMARGADRISDLPEGVLHHILSLLPARDAVRTCVLAQSWRNRWRSAPALRIACLCSPGSHGVDGAFGRFVDGLLRARRGGPPLDFCDFDLEVDSDIAESYFFDLGRHGNNWFRHVLDLKVRELRFRVYCDCVLPFRLEFRPVSSQHLTSLKLTGGVLDNAHVLDLSGCSALASLSMEDCPFYLMEMHSPSLKHLSIKNCTFYSKQRTVLSFPSLVSFKFIANSGNAPMLERMPHLEAAKVQLDPFCEDQCKMGRLDDCGDATCRSCSNYYGPGGSGCVFLHGLAEATHLNLSAHPHMYVFSRDLKWCPAFNMLKTLVLSKWFLSADLSALIWFLHHTPLLDKLTLEFPNVCKTLMTAEGSCNPLEKSIAPSHLQNVEIKCKYVDGIVLKVLKVLNANGIPRGKIRIQCSGYNFVCTDINK